MSIKNGGFIFSKQTNAENPLSEDRVFLYVNESGDIVARYHDGTEKILTADNSIYSTKEQFSDLVKKLEDVKSFANSLSEKTDSLNENTKGFNKGIEQLDTLYISSSVLPTLYTKDDSKDIINKISELDNKIDQLSNQINKLDEIFLLLKGGIIQGDLAVNGDLYVTGTEHVIRKEITEE